MIIPQFTIEESDDGKVLTLSDSSEGFSNPLDTLVTNVIISMAWNNSTSVEVFNQNYTGTVPQYSLIYTIGVEDFTNQTISSFVDGFYDFTYNITADGTTYINDIEILLDYNSKKYTYDLYMNAPYKLNYNLAFNSDIQKCMVADVILTGMQYDAAVNQTLRSQDALEQMVRLSNISTTQTIA